MTEIDVQTIQEADPFVFRVTVREGTGETQHRVTLARADYQRLSGGMALPGESGLDRQGFCMIACLVSDAQCIARHKSCKGAAAIRVDFIIVNICNWIKSRVPAFHA